MHNKKYYTLGLLQKILGTRTGSTVSWNTRLENYKSHIKQSVHDCKKVKHFIEKCNDPIVAFKYLRFVILDILTNTESLSKDDIEDV